MMYMNIWTGEALTYKEMMNQYREEYDGDDPTGCCGLDEYYVEIPDCEEAE